jgi:hypothetical protein
VPGSHGYGDALSKLRAYPQHCRCVEGRLGGKLEPASPWGPFSGPAVHLRAALSRQLLWNDLEGTEGGSGEGTAAMADRGWAGGAYRVGVGAENCRYRAC